MILQFQDRRDNIARRRQDYTAASIFASPNTSQIAEGNVPAADRIWFYDNSAQQTTLLQVGSGLSISGTTIDGTGAPSDADYLVKTASGSLSAERVVTDTSTVTWDWATAGQAKANTNVTYKVLQTAVSKTNNTFANCTDLSTTLTASHWYLVEFQFILSSGSVTGGQWDFNGGAATATAVEGVDIVTSLEGSGNYITAERNALSQVLGNGSGESLIANGSFVIQVNAGGTLIPRFAQDTTNATPSVFAKYSWMRVSDITP